VRLRPFRFSFFFSCSRRPEDLFSLDRNGTYAAFFFSPPFPPCFDRRQQTPGGGATGAGRFPLLPLFFLCVAPFPFPSFFLCIPRYQLRISEIGDQVSPLFFFQLFLVRATGPKLWTIPLVYFLWLLVVSGNNHSAYAGEQVCFRLRLSLRPPPLVRMCGDGRGRPSVQDLGIFFPCCLPLPMVYWNRAHYAQGFGLINVVFFHVFPLLLILARAKGPQLTMIWLSGFLCLW